MFVFQISGSPFKQKAETKAATERQFLAGLTDDILQIEMLRRETGIFRQDFSFRLSSKAPETSSLKGLRAKAGETYSKILGLMADDPALQAHKKKDNVSYQSLVKAIALCEVVFEEFGRHAQGFIGGGAPIAGNKITTSNIDLRMDIIKCKWDYFVPYSSREKETGAQGQTPRGAGPESAAKKDNAFVSKTLQEPLSGQIEALEKMVFKNGITGIVKDAAKQLYADSLKATGEEREKGLALYRQIAVRTKDLAALVPDTAYTSHYANFFAAIESGFVEKEFFLKNFAAFQKLVSLIDDAQASGTSKSIAFEFKTRKEAELFDKGLSKLSVMSFDPEKGTDHSLLQDGKMAFFKFGYAPAQGVPANAESRPISPAQGIIPSGIYNGAQTRTVKKKDRLESMLPTGMPKLESSSGLVDINYNAKEQIVYAAHFNPNDPVSRKIVKGIATNQLALFYADKNLTKEDVAKLSPKEKENLLREMRVVGSASLESPKQYAQNKELAQKRADMLATEIIRQVMGPKAEANEYLGMVNIGAAVVSPWEIKGKVKKEEADAVLASIMDSMSSAKNKYAGAEEFHYGILSDIMTGNYNTARSLIQANVKGKNEQKELLGLVGAVEKKQGKSAPAINDRGNGSYEIANQALAAELWSTQGSGIGLRFETMKEAGGKLKTYEPETQKQFIGAVFTSIIEKDYARSASLHKADNAELSITMKNPGTLYAPNQETTVTLDVGYTFGKRDGYFGPKSGKLNVAVTDEKGTEIDSKVSPGVKDGQYLVSFTAPPKGEVKIIAEAFKPGLGISSGFVETRLTSLAVPRELRSMNIEPVKEAAKAKFIDFVFIPPFSANLTAEYHFPIYSENTPYSNILNTALEGIALANGGAKTLNPDNTYGYSFQKLSGQELANLLSAVPDAYTQWLNSPIKTGSSTTVRQDLANKGLISDMGQFEQYLRQSNIDGAIGLINTGKAGGKALANSFGTYKNALSLLEYANIAKAIENNRFGAIGEIRVELDKVGLQDTDLYFYYNRTTGQFGVTDDSSTVQTAGFRVVKKLENARLRFIAGHTWVNAKIEVPPQWFIGIGGELGIPLSDFMTATFQADVYKTFQTRAVKTDAYELSLEGKQIVDINTGLVWAPTSNFRTSLRAGLQSQVGSLRTPTMSPYLQLGAGYKPFDWIDLVVSPQMTIMKGSLPSYQFVLRFGL